MLPDQQRFIAATAGIDPKLWAKLAPKDFLFTDDQIALGMFHYMQTQLRNTGKLPTLETINEKFSVFLQPDGVDPEYIRRRLADRRIKGQLALATQALQDDIKSDPETALRAHVALCQSLLMETSNETTADFTQAASIAWPDLTAKWSGKKHGVPLVWPSLARMMGKVHGGEIVSVAGRTGLGKSWLLLTQALHVWATTDTPIAFVSMEMSAQKCMERLMALYLHVAADWFKHGETATLYGTNMREKVKGKLIELELSGRAPFHILDGNLTTSVEALPDICRGLRPSLLLVDGAYLLQVSSKRGLKGFEKIEEICTVLKRDVAAALDIPVFPSWQINRTGAKEQKKEGGKPALENIAGGAHIEYVSSTILALAADTDAAATNVEKMANRKLYVLKGRDGESGELELQWDFGGMNFTEIDKNAPVETYD